MLYEDVWRQELMNYLRVLSTLLICLISGSQAQTIVPLQLIQTIPLPGVEGYFDHMAIDLKGQRLFIPAEHQRTIEVVDLRAGKLVHTITGLEGNPRKIIYLAESDHICGDLRH